MGLSNHALSLAAASPLLVVFDALPISIVALAGLNVKDLLRPSPSDARETKTESTVISRAQTVLRLTDQSQLWKVIFGELDSDTGLEVNPELTFRCRHHLDVCRKAEMGRASCRKT